MSTAKSRPAASNRTFPDSASHSASLFERATKVMPGGNTRHTVYYPPYPIYAVRGQGCRVWDADGVERIDVINNYSALIHGHNHPKIVEAVIAQAQDLLSIAMPTEKEIELAEIVTARVPGIERIRFANSGTEGVLLAIKAARAYTGRPKIAKVEGAYHGSDDTAGISTNPSPDKWGDPHAPASVAPNGTGPGAAQDVVVLPMNQVDDARRIIQAHAHDLAGVLIDPVVKNLGYKEASPAFLKMLREETKRIGALLIFDEVYSFRLGFNGAQGAVGITPDLTAMGKIIGGGLPVGAVGGSAEVMSVFDQRAGRPRLGHGGTFNANPMTMAAGVAAMQQLWDKPAFDRLSRLGDRLRAGLREALKIADAPGVVTGVTSMTALFHMNAEIETYRDAAKATMANPGAGKRAEQFFHHMLNHGVMMGAAGFFVLSTPMTDADVDHIIEVALDGLRKIK